MKKLAQTALLALALAIGAIVATSQDVYASHDDGRRLGHEQPAPGYDCDEYEVEPRPTRPEPVPPLRENATEEEIAGHEQATRDFREAEDAYYAAFTQEEILTTVPETERGRQLLRDTLATFIPEPARAGDGWFAYQLTVARAQNVVNYIIRLAENFNSVNRERFSEISDNIWISVHTPELIALFETNPNEAARLHEQLFREALDNSEGIQMHRMAIGIFNDTVRQVATIRNHAGDLFDAARLTRGTLNNTTNGTSSNGQPVFIPQSLYDRIREGTSHEVAPHILEALEENRLFPR